MHLAVCSIKQLLEVSDFDHLASVLVLHYRVELDGRYGLGIHH